MGAYTVYTAHQATIPPPPPLPILRPLRRYSFSQCFIDPERCFVCINKLENLPRTHTQTDRQTDREFNYRGHSIAVSLECQVEQANIWTDKQLKNRGSSHHRGGCPIESDQRRCGKYKNSHISRWLLLIKTKSFS